MPAPRRSATSRILPVIALVLVSCQGAPAAQDAGGLRVAASFYPLGYVAQEVVGTHAEVTIVTPAGAEPHSYEPTARDIVALTGSDVLLLVGDRLESWGPRVAEQLRGSGTTVLVLGDDVATRTVTHDGVPSRDPHVWLDPMNVAAMGERVRDALTRIDPAHTADYAANATALTARMRGLDDAFRLGLQRCARREVVVSHEAFGYLADRYGLTQVPVAGLSPEEEPSAQQLAEITELVRARGVTTIFTEELVSPRLAETIAAETGATVRTLDPVAGVSDEDARAGRGYVEQMEENLAVLRAALACE